MPKSELKNLNYLAENLVYIFLLSASSLFLSVNALLSLTNESRAEEGKGRIFIFWRGNLLF